MKSSKRFESEASEAISHRDSKGKRLKPGPLFPPRALVGPYVLFSGVLWRS